MASPSTVITLGYGSFGGVELLPTLGYGIGAVAVVTGTHCVEAAQLYAAGAEASDVYASGAERGDLYGAGAEAGKGGC